MANRTVKAELQIDGKDHTQKAFKSVAVRLGQMERQMSRFNKVAGDFNRKVGSIDKVMSGRNMGFANAQLAKMNAQLANASGAMMGLENAAMMTASRFLGPAALGAGLLYATKQAGNFEEALFSVQKKSGATAEQMAKIREEILDLSREIPVSIEEIASAFERGAAAGIPLDELKEFSKLTAATADAWDSTAENVGNAFAGFSAGMGIARKDLQAYASLINDLADSGISSEVDIVDFVDRAGASLKNFGLTPEQIAGYGAAMLNLKIPAETAARAIDSLTGKLLAPENLSPKSRTALTAIVGDMKAFQKLSGDQKLAFFLRRVERLSAQQRASLLGAFVGDEFDDEIQRLVAGAKVLDQSLEMVERHAANPSNSIVKVQAAQLELFNKQLTLLQTNLKNVATAFGENLILPWLTDAMRQVNDAIRTLEDRKKSTQNMSLEERQQQQEAFIKRWRESNKDYKGNWILEGNKQYLEAQAAVGRGEYKSVEDVLTRQEEVRSYNARVAAAADQYRQYGEGRTHVSNIVEFPGGGRGYSRNNMPGSDAPVPEPRPAMSPYDLRRLQDQYMAYGGARITPEQFDAIYTKEQQHRATMVSTQVRTDGEVAWLPHQKTDPSVTTVTDLMRALDTGSNQFKEAAGEIVKGGEEGAGYFDQAASAIRAAGADAAQSILSALREGARILSSSQPVARGAAGQVNADRGRSMPPEGFGPR